MKYFDDMKISLKLSISLFIAIVSLGIMGYTGYYYLQQSSTEMNAMYTDCLIPVKLVNQIATVTRNVNALNMELMVTTDAKRKQQIKSTIDDTAKQGNNYYIELENAHLDSKGKDLLTKIQTSRQKYKIVRAQFIDLGSQNRNVEAYEFYANNVDPLASEYNNNLSALSDYYSKVSEKMSADNKVAVEKATQIILTILLLSFVILGLSGIYITKIITKPLNLMVIACRDFSTGDFRDKPRTVLQKDEIGQLADALVTMRDSLHDLMKHVNDSTEQLAASSEELTASAEQSAQASNQVAESITEVAKGSERQLSATNDATVFVQQISASIQNVAANANEVAEQSALAANKANEGNQSIDRAVNQVAHIEQTVTSSARVVVKLGERSKEIGEIVDTIAGIAGQTNLLALNAAIEAARAGEQGRGFAVVADEVRKLAEQSQEAAKKIAILIGEIQGDTDRAVVAMNDGTREAKLGAEAVNASGKVFQEIAGMVTLGAGKMKAISVAVGEMSLGSQQIVGSVKHIADLSKAASSEAQTVSAATEEQSASMEEIASASQALAHLAMNLREAVNKFQI
jgi:methyl-accepting chemotaxis protein